MVGSAHHLDFAEARGHGFRHGHAIVLDFRFAHRAQEIEVWRMEDEARVRRDRSRQRKNDFCDIDANKVKGAETVPLTLDEVADVAVAGRLADHGDPQRANPVAVTGRFLHVGWKKSDFITESAKIAQHSNGRAFSGGKVWSRNAIVRDEDAASDGFRLVFLCRGEQFSETPGTAFFGGTLEPVGAAMRKRLGQKSEGPQQTKKGEIIEVLPRPAIGLVEPPQQVNPLVSELCNSGK